MYRYAIPEKWDEKKKILLERYPELSKKDVVYHKGYEEQLISHLQARLNKSRSELKRILRSL